MCAHRKSETLEAFQALEEGRVERLDGKTPVPPSKGRLARRQSSPSLPREVRLPAWQDHIPSPQAGLLFPTTFSFISATCFSLPLLPPPDILSPPSVTHQDSALKWQQPLHPLGARGFSSVQFLCTGVQLLSGKLFNQAVSQP